LERLHCEQGEHWVCRKHGVERVSAFSQGCGVSLATLCSVSQGRRFNLAAHFLNREVAGGQGGRFSHREVGLKWGVKLGSVWWRTRPS